MVCSNDGSVTQRLESNVLNLRRLMLLASAVVLFHLFSEQKEEDGKQLLAEGVR